MFKTRTLALLSLSVVLAACGDRCGAQDPATPTPAAEPATPQDPLADRLAELEKLGAALPPGGDAASPEREAFRTAARALGEEAITAQRADIAASVGRVLTAKGERGLAEAFLQRSVGLVQPAKSGVKDHLFPLAELKRSQGHILEAASLFERAIDVDPTAPSEFVGLSDLYLAAGRIGPARAAVTRGLARHPEAPALLSQGAEVELLAGDLEKARAGVSAARAKDADDLGARILEVEIALAAGELDAATTGATALRTAVPDSSWGWTFGAVAARARGDVAAAEPLLQRALEVAGDCPCTHEDRLAIAWAGTVVAGPQVAPRVRTEQSTDPILPAGEAPAVVPPSAAVAPPAGGGAAR